MNTNTNNTRGGNRNLTRQDNFRQGFRAAFATSTLAPLWAEVVRAALAGELPTAETLAEFGFDSEAEFRRFAAVKLRRAQVAN